MQWSEQRDLQKKENRLDTVQAMSCKVHTARNITNKTLHHVQNNLNIMARWTYVDAYTARKPFTFVFCFTQLTVQHRKAHRLETDTTCFLQLLFTVRCVAMDPTPTDLDHPQRKRFRASSPLLSKLPLTLLRHAKPPSSSTRMIQQPMQSCPTRSF